MPPSKVPSWQSSPARSARDPRSKSARSPATAHYASRAHCPPTASFCAATSTNNGPASGRHYWERAGIANKITLKLAPAAETLKALPASHTFDFAFIDADKTSYAIYYEEILKRLRPNGLIIVDNVLWNGAIIDETKQDADTQALRKLNDFIAKDTRVEAVMVGIADGLTIVRKK